MLIEQVQPGFATERGKGRRFGRYCLLGVGVDVAVDVLNAVVVLLLYFGYYFATDVPTVSSLVLIVADTTIEEVSRTDVLTNIFCMQSCRSFTSVCPSQS